MLSEDKINQLARSMWNSFRDAKATPDDVIRVLGCLVASICLVSDDPTTSVDWFVEQLRVQTHETMAANVH